jgi:hypothetical protein
VNKQQAKELVADMSWEDVKSILRSARENIQDDEHWEKRSKINKILSKGKAFNIYWNGIEKHTGRISEEIRFVARNIMYEFGEDAGFKPTQKKKKPLPPVYHEDPVKF